MKNFLYILLILALTAELSCTSISPKATASGNASQLSADNDANTGKTQPYEDHRNTASGNTNTSPALSNQPPDAVLSSFRNRYPGFTANDWTTRQGKYCTTYIREGISYSAFFTPSGEWVGTETDIVMSDLPALVRKAYQNGLYGKAASPRVLRIENNKHPVLYRIEGQVNNQLFVQYFNAEGQEVQVME